MMAEIYDIRFAQVCSLAFQVLMGFIFPPAKTILVSVYICSCDRKWIKLKLLLPAVT